MTALFVSLLSLAAATPGGEDGVSLRAAFHIHTSFSDGAHDLEQLARMAAAKGIDVLVLADHYRTEISYGPPLLRQSLALHLRPPAVDPDELADYLHAARRAEERTGVLILPGLELTPYYFWGGSVLRGDLTLHSAHRHLLVVFPDGVSPSRLPPLLVSMGSPGALRLGPSSLWLLWPAGPLAWALGRLIRPGTKQVTTRSFIIEQRRGRLLPAAAAVAALALLIRSWPFSTHQWDPYAPDAGAAPYQDAIDRARGSASLVFWAHPETSTSMAHPRYPVSYRSDAYPDLLIRTDRAHGFAALYEGYRRAAAPGGFWDGALESFLRGERAEPLWSVGELDLHEIGEAGGKDLGEVETVLLAKRRSRPAAFAALAAGAMYAVRHRGGGRVLLDGFRIACGNAASGMGGRIAAAGECEVEARLRGEGAPLPDLRLVLIRNGVVVREQDAGDPREEIHLLHSALERARPAYYRLVVYRRSDPVLFGNPVFVGTGGGGS